MGAEFILRTFSPQEEISGRRSYPVTTDVLPGSKRLVHILDRWLNDCLKMTKDSSSFGTAVKFISWNWFYNFHWNLTLSYQPCS